MLLTDSTLNPRATCGQRLKSVSGHEVSDDECERFRRQPRCHRLLEAVRPEALRPRLLPGLPSGGDKVKGRCARWQRVGMHGRLRATTSDVCMRRQLTRLLTCTRTPSGGQVKRNIM